MLLENNNILILYDYRYYCDFKIVFNLFNQYIMVNPHRGFPYSVPMPEYEHPIGYYIIYDIAWIPYI